MKKMKTSLPKLPTLRDSMPMKHWEAMGKQNPQMPGRKLMTRRMSTKFPGTMNFYYR